MSCKKGYSQRLSLMITWRQVQSVANVSTGSRRRVKMGLEEFYMISQVVAALAVVATLLFVGYQVRQSDLTQRAMSLQSVLDGHRDRTFGRLSEGDGLADLWARGLTSFDDLNDSEKRRYFSFMFEQCFQMQQVIMLQKRGLLPKADYDAWLCDKQSRLSVACS